MEIVLLEPEDAEIIETLAGYHYPPDYFLSVDDILENLERADEESFCFGVQMEGKLMGYAMAWIDETMVEGGDGRVLLVDDIVLGNKVRNQLFNLLQAMIGEMESRGFGKLPIEGSARPSSSSTFLGHPEAFERLGYALAQKAEYEDEDFNETLTWVRFETIIEEDAVINEDDELEIEFGNENSEAASEESP